MNKVNIAEKFGMISEHWSPKIVARVQDCDVKLGKFLGEFEWHHHPEQDEMFLVVKGHIVIKFRDKDVALDEGELLVVPKGVEHLPVAEKEAWIMMVEPAGTLNTGNTVSARTVAEPERI